MNLSEDGIDKHLAVAHLLERTHGLFHSLNVT